MTEFINDELSQLETDPESFCLVSDDDGHWYVIPDDQKKEFEQWVADTQNGEESDYDFEDAIINCHPSCVHFSSYWIDS